MMKKTSAGRWFLMAVGLVGSTCCCGVSGAAEETRGLRPDAASGSSPARRSHLQPVGEMVAPRTADDLGLRLVRASAVLRRQLALERGCGLVVEGVAPDSIAMRSGFAEHDVLVMLDDQLLLLPEQFNALLEATPAGATVQCRLLRGGRRLVIPLGGTGAVTLAGAEPVKPQLRPAASTLAILPRAVELEPEDRRPQAPQADVGTSETLMRKDADFSIRLTRGDETRLMVTDPQGRLIFNDAIDTPAARSRMPVAVRSRVEAMERLLDPTVPAAAPPVAEIGRLDVEPVEVR